MTLDNLSKAIALCYCTLINLDGADGTMDEVDGCDHSSVCIARYYRTIWIVIIIASALYILMCIWTYCASKFKVKEGHTADWTLFRKGV